MFRKKQPIESLCNGCGTCVGVCLLIRAKHIHLGLFIEGHSVIINNVS